MKIIYEYCEACKSLTIHDIEGNCVECLPLDCLDDEQYAAVINEMARLACFTTVALKYAKHN
jgi:hypothetical protein